MVDITNYVMLEIGQPMHAFDMSTLESCQIIVRRAQEGEKIVTLDSKEFTLNPNNLVICDGAKPVALAGVMGGLNSEITDKTTQLLFESAKFARDSIRKTSRSLGQSTDALQPLREGRLRVHRRAGHGPRPAPDPGAGLRRGHRQRL